MSGLKQHMLTHQRRPRNYFCLQCDKSFYQQSSLNAHIKIHLGDAGIVSYNISKQRLR